MKPRNLKQAIAAGFVIKKILYKGNAKCWVELQRRFYRPDEENFASFWISSKYVERNYPRSFEVGSY